MKERDGDGLVKKGRGFKQLHGTSYGNYAYQVGKQFVKFIDLVSGHGKEYRLSEVHPEWETWSSKLYDGEEDCRPAITPQMLRDTVAPKFRDYLATKKKKRSK